MVPRWYCRRHSDLLLHWLPVQPPPCLPELRRRAQGLDNPGSADPLGQYDLLAGYIFLHYLRQDLKLKDESAAQQLLELMRGDKVMKGDLAFNIWILLYIILSIVVNLTSPNKDPCGGLAIGNLVLLLIHFLVFAGVFFAIRDRSKTWDDGPQSGDKKKEEGDAKDKKKGDKKSEKNPKHQA